MQDDDAILFIDSAVAHLQEIGHILLFYGRLRWIDYFLQEFLMLTRSEQSSGHPSQHRPSHPNIHQHP